MERDILLTNLSESTIVVAALDWLKGFGWVVASGQDFSPDGFMPECP